jgi:hypothetical protein
MSASSTPPRDFVFLEGLDPSHYERNIRSYVSRKAWKEKRLEQVRKYQTSFPTPPLTTHDPHQTLTRSSAKPLESRVDNAQLSPLDLTRLAVDNTRVERQHDSLLTATERELINVDPFHTLPCRLDRSGQDLAHRAKSLFLQSSPNWSSALFTETTGLRLAYTYKANFCSMLACASNYLDSLSGRGPSLETLQWTSATTSCVRRTLSNPVTQGGDEALMGVFLLLANDQLVDGGKNGHLHSKALAQLFRLRGGLESLRLPYAMELFISFLLITPFGRTQIAYLDHMESDAEGAAELQEWKADVDLLILELQNLDIWDRAIHWESRERRALLIKVVKFLPHPKDAVEQDQWAFIITYLAVMLWEYRYRPRDCDNLLRDLTHHYEQLGQGFNLADVAWVLVRGLDRERHRKWQVIRMIRVLHRLSNQIQLKVARSVTGHERL